MGFLFSVVVNLPPPKKRFECTLLFHSCFEKKTHTLTYIRTMDQFVVRSRFIRYSLPTEYGCAGPRLVANTIILISGGEGGGGDPPRTLLYSTVRGTFECQGSPTFQYLTVGVPTAKIKRRFVVPPWKYI